MGNNSEVSKLVVDKEEFKKQLEERIELGNKIFDRNILFSTDLEQAQSEYDSWNDYNSELLKQSFNNPHSEYRKDYDKKFATVTIFYNDDRQSFLQSISWFRSNLEDKLSSLRNLINKLDLLKSDLTLLSINKTQFVDSKDIFIVHGHDEAVREKVARFLEKLSLKPIILHEQANSGKIIIEKFESHANVGFAVILLTGDDVGKVKNAANDSPRARQNVILEWGFFIGKLGRNRVCALYEKGVELPSDLHGLLYVSLDGRGWQMDLAKELKTAGYEIDLNKLL